MLKLIDTHAHLDEIEDLDAVLQKARESVLAAVIAVGSSYESNLKILELGNRYPGFVYPALGLHPWELHKFDQDRINETLKHIEANIANIAAVGEIGLDYDKRVLKLTSKERQKEVFKLILEIAAKYDKPVSIHSRYAWKDCFDIVKSTGTRKAVFHWFTGFSSVLREIIDNGYFISGNPAAEYHEEHRRAIREAPLEQLLLETDCPVTYGRETRYRALPSDVIRGMKAAALLKNVPEETIALQTTSNATRVFKIAPGEAT
jgi:TatD DNase family protein